MSKAVLLNKKANGIAVKLKDKKMSRKEALNHIQNLVHSSELEPNDIHKIANTVAGMNNGVPLRNKLKQVANKKYKEAEEKKSKDEDMLNSIKNDYNKMAKAVKKAPKYSPSISREALKQKTKSSLSKISDKISGMINARKENKAAKEDELYQKQRNSDLVMLKRYHNYHNRWKEKEFGYMNMSNTSSKWKGVFNPYKNFKNMPTDIDEIPTKIRNKLSDKNYKPDVSDSRFESLFDKNKVGEKYGY